LAEKSFVIITNVPEMNYRQDFVALPRDYGTPAYFNRPDVQAIRDTVYRSLGDLDVRTHFSEKMRGKKVLIKPNLVEVFHKFGNFIEPSYPESTDPRVFEAVVSFFRQYTDKIAIIESSGKSVPTSLSFKMTGLDRVAKYYQAECVPLELQPVVRYMLPKAEVMKEVHLPKILEDVVKGEAFYISVPKMKTNMYTGVTLGFKNAMGTLPYNLRMRNHNYRIHKKLVDLLYLFRPDITVIDGIIGAEGNTPAPVDPVDVGVIICGNNSVETDRVATRVMGIDPEQNKLLVEAVRRGFHDPDVTVIGAREPVAFRQASMSLIDASMRADFPGLRVLLGHQFDHAPKIADINSVTPEIVVEMEKACDGGCSPATKTAFELMRYTAGFDRNFELTVIIGSGVQVGEKKVYFDRAGNAYDVDAIRAIPGKKLCVGECAKDMRPFCEFTAEGCCNAPNCLFNTYKATGRPVPVFSAKNQYLGDIAVHVLKTYFGRRALVQAGQWIDIPYAAEDKIYEHPPLSLQEMQQDYIEWPLPALTPELKKAQLKEVTLYLGV
jgi:uncharacterized protein (DUF362 family)